VELPLSYTFHGETNNTGILHEAGTDFEYSVTDANNCKPVKGTFTVVQPDPLALAASTKDASCFGTSTGSVTGHCNFGLGLNILGKRF
jgi:hypothetical protein